MQARDCVRGIGPIGGRPVDFISPIEPPDGEGGALAGLSVPLFFSGFLPLFSGASGFRVAVFLRSFRYSRVVLLPPLSLSLSLSLTFLRAIRFFLSLSLSFSVVGYVYRNVPVSLTASFHTSFLSLSNLTLFSLALFFLAFAFVFCQPPFAALRVRFV